MLPKLGTDCDKCYNIYKCMYKNPALNNSELDKQMRK